MSTSTLSKGRVFAHLSGNLLNVLVVGYLILGLISLADGSKNILPERVVSETKTDRLPKTQQYPDPGTLSFVEKDSVSTADEVELAKGVYFEARSESYEGQERVARAILRRVSDPRWPNSIKAVLSQGEHRRNRCQFSYMCDGKPEHVTNKRAWSRALMVAKRVYRAWQGGEDIGCAHSYRATYVTSKAALNWFATLQEVEQVGVHKFYCDKKI